MIEKIKSKISFVLISMFALQAAANDATKIAGGKPLENVEYPQFCGPNQIISSVGKIDGHHIYLLSLDGKIIRQVSNMKHDMEPSCSKDGKKMAFASYGENGDSFSLAIMDMSGKTVKWLSKAPQGNDQYPCWSPDGKYVVWTHGVELWKANSDGSHPHQLVPSPTKRFQYCGGWSADGKQIAYLGGDATPGSKICVVNADGTGAKQLRNGILAVDVKWSKDSKSLYFNSGDGLMKVDVTGDKPSSKVSNLGSEASHFDLSSDEKMLVYDDPGPEIDTAVYLKKLE